MLLSLLSKRTLEVDSRDAYGFTVRPQHLHRFKEYAEIYKEEEEERQQKWNRFLKQQEEYALSNFHTDENLHREENAKAVDAEESEKCKPVQEVIRDGDDSFQVESVGNINEEIGSQRGILAVTEQKSRDVQKWSQIRSSLSHIECMMSFRVKKRKNMKDVHIPVEHDHIPSTEQGSHLAEDFEQENEKELSGNLVHDGMNTSKAEDISSCGVSSEPSFPWNEELEFLVHGGVPRDLRGEVWQAFVGVTTRRVENYYQDLLGSENEVGDSLEHDKPSSIRHGEKEMESRVNVPEKWRKQIEKVVRCMEPGLYRSVF